MNREIKFRGRRIDNGEWVYGYLFRQTGVKNGASSEGFYIGMDLEDYHEVDPETVGQCTGLKDKNGKEIYERDIMSTFAILASDSIGSNPFNVSVKWNGCGWIANGSLSKYQCRISEVIGNIHENPELLK